ncbi:ABC transporter permease [Nostocoides sp. HKS02]|uniref:ABC transporter permease n=1 Tax=Nostocoides sp. HKS02 TaxID=1813880 RepID=UPI0012B48634|nr:ABC transporter permease [Tetrasphaera sp. HKS02]QGN58543.1 ABC transporter permease subunit [Tetrasphaera sp. HKS02]
MIANILSWLADPAHWSGDDGIPHRLWEHLWYSALALGIAAVIAIPIGLAIGHTGRGRFFVVNLAGAARAIPSLGLLYLMVLWLFPQLSGDSAFLVPSEIVLVVLAIPPMMSGAYAGVDEVDPAARDAAKGMGMTGLEVLRKVEVPCALPLVFSGVRSGALQVVATTTIAAVAGLGGLGRFLIDGQKVRDFPQMASGAVLVALLALAVDLVLALAQRYAVSPGLSGRMTRGGNTPNDVEIDTRTRTVDTGRLTQKPAEQ